MLKNDAIVVHFFTQQMRAIANNDLCLMSNIISKYFFNEETAEPIGAAKQYLWTRGIRLETGKAWGEDHLYS
ncbi:MULTISPECIES: hypothetical protein [unclassified Microcoleus]|uniref:hypothetical protein n=1 Tax=unclassified Microcoleus TaxID=2642155 RepID=UPI002FCEC9C8